MVRHGYGMVMVCDRIMVHAVPSARYCNNTRTWIVMCASCMRSTRIRARKMYVCECECVCAVWAQRKLNYAIMKNCLFRDHVPRTESLYINPVNIASRSLLFAVREYWGNARVNSADEWISCVCCDLWCDVKRGTLNDLLCATVCLLTMPHDLCACLCVFDASANIYAHWRKRIIM